MKAPSTSYARTEEPAQAPALLRQTGSPDPSGDRLKEYRPNTPCLACLASLHAGIPKQAFSPASAAPRSSGQRCIIMNALAADSHRPRWFPCLWALGFLTPILYGIGHAPSALNLEHVRLSTDGRRFVLSLSGTPFVPWGFNYDHDDAGRLLEDYWEAEWGTVVEDFGEMKALGANVVRIHLQLGRFMRAAETPDAEALARLGKLLALAESTGLYLNLTGLGCYHRRDVPAWYDALSEADRWAVQARFWESIAGLGAGSPAVFCYDLMNEPILPGEEKEIGWLAGDFGGKHFVQRISLDLAGRSREQVARAWVDTLVTAIRRRDPRHLITVGEIPWAHHFPGAKPLFQAQEVGRRLDFVSLHIYPKKGEVDRAIAALKVYDVGKPIVVEEMFPMKCGLQELDDFVEKSRYLARGWIGFYWGKGIEECRREGDLKGAIMAGWLEYFREKAPRMRVGE